MLADGWRLASDGAWSAAARFRDHKGINLPGVQVSAPSKRIGGHAFGRAAGMDMIALSFVRTPGRRRAARGEGRISRSSPRSKSRQGCENIESILDGADGVMVARGDLGVEIPLEEVPRIRNRSSGGRGARAGS